MRLDLTAFICCLIFCAPCSFFSEAHAQSHQSFALPIENLSPDFERGLAQIQKLAGCYVVDYSFSEVESLKLGYVIDGRVYDTNLGKTTRELIIPIRKSPTEIRLQHVLFVTGSDGKAKFVMKHQAEDWAYESPFLYEFVSPNSWIAKMLPPNSGAWTRKVTNLDDGLRYQCSATFDFSKEQPEWQCENFAPIPGRETRDMGRNDYNTLQRVTHFVDYGASFLERQRNIKTIFDAGKRIPLAREEGKNWYIRQPKSACAQALVWATPRLAFWEILREEWDKVFNEAKEIKELPSTNGKSRYISLGEIEESFYERVANDPIAAHEARVKIREVIANSLSLTE
jgi:hypothetical protein